MSDRLRSRARANPWLFDGALVGALVVIGLISLFHYPAGTTAYLEGDALGVLILLVTTVPLVLRRVSPVWSGIFLAIATLAYLKWDYASLAVTATMLIAVYSAGAYAALRPGLAVFASHFIVTVAYLAVFFGGLALGSPGSVNLAFATLGYAGAWAIGRGMRKSRAYTAELEKRAQHLEEASAAEVRAALAEERSRIARELHDVVAHHVSVMTVQAAGAQRSLAKNPERSSEALRSIETTGRAALAEMRRIVGVLRGPERSGRIGERFDTHRSPQPGVADLESLAEQMRSTGVDVTLIHDGDIADLPTGVGVTVFRIVQEALTNTLKHAGPSSAQVILTRSNDAISVRVRDDGRGLAAQLDGHRPGHGLLGIRERVALYGGTLAAGPRHGGGYEVQARIPFDHMEHTAVHS